MSAKLVVLPSVLLAAVMRGGAAPYEPGPTLGAGTRAPRPAIVGAIVAREGDRCEHGWIEQHFAWFAHPLQIDRMQRRPRSEYVQPIHSC